MTINKNNIYRKATDRTNIELKSEQSGTIEFVRVYFIVLLFYYILSLARPFVWSTVNISVSLKA